ncbi:RCC2 protein, partial [Prunella himalayana]|nr:RCC2 protein [Prunella himalayana]
QKLEGSKSRGQLLIFGATNWDLIGRKEVPKQQAAYRNLGQNLWGPHRYGSLGGLRVRSVVSGPCAAHSLLITAEGKLWSWGRNEKGQLGHGDTKRVEAPRPIEALGSEAIVAAACGRNHTLALTESGSVFAFGENKLGQLGLGNQTDAVPSPTQILYNGQPISKLGCGAEFSMVMDCKGNLYSFGCPEYGQLGTEFGLVLDSQKRVFSWGFGGYGRLGHAEQKDEMVPRLVKLFDFPGRGAAQIYAGYTCSFAVSETGGNAGMWDLGMPRGMAAGQVGMRDLGFGNAKGDGSKMGGNAGMWIWECQEGWQRDRWGPGNAGGPPAGQGYGDHKPKSSTAAQEVKTLDGIYTEQV